MKRPLEIIDLTLNETTIPVKSSKLEEDILVTIARALPKEILPLIYEYYCYSKLRDLALKHYQNYCDYGELGIYVCLSPLGFVCNHGKLNFDQRMKDFKRMVADLYWGKLYREFYLPFANDAKLILREVFFHPNDCQDNKATPNNKLARTYLERIPRVAKTIKETIDFVEKENKKKEKTL